MEFVYPKEKADSDVVNPLMNSHQPILVTGSHRSGTTWIGRMLAQAPSLFYIHEPFSVTDAPSRGVCNTEFKYWFTYITRQNEDGYYKPLRRTIRLRYDLLGGLRSYDSKETIRELRREYLLFWRHRMKGSKALVKDPMAFFSAEWMAERFNMNVVMVIRHPADDVGDQGLPRVSEFPKRNRSFRHALKTAPVLL